jgi:pimeloyl-ACP methyl ester carboxylesterase
MSEVSARGLRFHVQRLGAGAAAPASRPVVVFLHGLVMDNLSSWFFTAAAPVAKHAEVVLYDLRGHGKSERPATGYGLADMVADLAAVLDALAIARPVVLVGNSFGGLLALAFAAAHPARAAGLVLVEGHFGDDGFAKQMAETLSLEGEECDRRIAESFSRWLGRHSQRKSNRLAETASALVKGTTLIADMASTAPLEPADLARVQAPVLGLYGETSDLRAGAEQAFRALPRARLEILAGCTHSILWEATSTVRDRILAFVADTGGAAPAPPAPGEGP